MKATCMSRLAIAILIVAGNAWAQTDGPAPPTDVIAMDHPWDGGDHIDVSWTLSVDDPANVASYKIYRTLSEAEMAKEDTDARLAAVNAAKAAATKEIFALADERGLSHDDPGVLADVRAARHEAEKTALQDIKAAIDQKNGFTRYKFIGVLLAGNDEFRADKLELGTEYSFKIVAFGKNGQASVPAYAAAAVAPTRQGFDGSRFYLSLIVILICGSVIYFIDVARSGRSLNVRKIAGLQAVDEAVGRATEMGRSILFVPGIQDINDIQTIAGITVLSRVAKTAAEYDARLEVPTSRSLVMTTAREAVQASFLAAGRPDAFNQDLIYYVTDEQFGYVAYVSGMMVREKPAACFYMGSFFAESLILAETGNSIGAIQVAGTAQPAQLPFFVAACDYTLIGEEFFAASAYLSGEPDQLGSLKGQDVGKALVAGIMVIGIVMFTLATISGIDSGFGQTMLDAVDYLKSVILT